MHDERPSKSANDDPMQSQTASDQAVTKATGRPWKEWFALLKKAKADKLSHKEIARKLSHEHGVNGWWAQSITVEFERFIGRRELGQTSAGDYQTATSKTLAGSIDDALKVWQRHVGKRTDFNGVPFANEPKVSKTEKWRYWRVNLEDGSKLTVTIGSKPDGKTLLAINHDKLPDKRAGSRWKAYWKGFLNEQNA
ncbi:MAG: DUF4287 domain-containing protein [Dongiaceae bacterium]